MKKRTTIITTGISIVLLIILAGILLYPLFRPGFPVTDDGDWMVIRLSAFYQSFREGQFPVRFLGRLYHGYGYPVANFLYPGFMYIGSMLHAVGFPFTTSVKLIMFVSVAIGTCATFGWLRKFFRPVPSFFGAATFLFMPYVLYDVLTRGSVGELLAMCMMMVALYAFDGKQRVLFPFAVALLSISHNTLALFFLPILFIYIMLRHSWEYLLFFIYGVGMSAFFWIPAWFERSVVQFDTTAISDPLQYMKASQTLIIQSIPVLIAACILFFEKKKSFFLEKRFFFWVMMVSLFFASPISGFIWRSSILSTFIQFPYRFLAVICVIGPWFIGNIADRFDKKISIIIIGMCMAFLIFSAYQHHTDTRTIQPEGFYTTNEDTTTTHNEYLPIWATKQVTEHATDRLVFVTGDAKIEVKHMNLQTIDVVLHAREKSILQVNTIDYPGWGAMLDDHPIPILHTNPYGLIQVMIPPGTHHLFMEFRETAGRFVADVASVAFFVLSIVSLIYYAHHQKQTVRKTGKKRT